jgi:hypothetical protein
MAPNRAHMPTGMLFHVPRTHRSDLPSDILHRAGAHSNRAGRGVRPSLSHSNSKRPHSSNCDRRGEVSKRFGSVRVIHGSDVRKLHVGRQIYNRILYCTTFYYMLIYADELLRLKS